MSVVAKATYRLLPERVELSSPDPLTPRDCVPAKAGADVVVIGVPHLPRGRRILGVALARGVEVLWARRWILSGEKGEPSVMAFDGSAVDLGPRAITFDGGSVADDVRCFNAAPVDQRLAGLEGGEQILLTGAGDADLATRLPAVTASALLGGEPLSLVGDTLEIDLERGLVSLIWRGHRAFRGSPPEQVEVALVPLIALEEVEGEPRNWTRSACRPTPDQPPIFGDALPATTLPAVDGRRPVVVKATFTGDGALVEHQPLLSGDRPDGYPSDLCPPKREVDVVALGHVYSGENPAVASARLQVGEVDARLVALGPRRWDDGVPTAPEPFERVPLRWENAFGGPEIAANPRGMGRGGPPPRLEDPRRLLRAEGDTPEPACFAPIPADFPIRDGGGTYDRAWQRERWPALPRDYDPQAHQVAPRRQRCASLTGDEPFSIDSLRPGGADWRGRLPGLRPHVFAWADAAEEVALRLGVEQHRVEAERHLLG
ncbi:MAG: DUF2169 domain-containing protein, partial [Myxococcales bacterium]|nr:DUF2169 domain-containing protein [Myxococcales bacterium]